MNYDIRQAKRFLSMLFQDGDYLTICSSNPGRPKGPEGKKEKTPLKGFKTKLRAESIAYAEWLIKQGLQVYFGVLPRSAETPQTGTPGKKEHIVGGCVAWVDIDSKEKVLPKLRALHYPPSLIIDSGNGYHAYWLLTDIAPPEQIEAVNKALTQELKCDASGWDYTQTLRVPGSLHLKDAQKPKLCKILAGDWHPERKYTLPELPYVPVTQAKKQGTRSPSPLQTTTPSHTSHKLLLTFVEHLPPHAQRFLIRGESMEGIIDTYRLVQSYVATLINYGWTEQHIRDFFCSSLPFKSIEVFHDKYPKEKTARKELERSIANALKTKEDSHNVLPQLLDSTCWRSERQMIPARQDTQAYLPTDKVALHRLATFAHDLYSEKQKGHYLATLPMGYGKTREFLLPFVTSCAKQLSPKGIVVAVERIEQVKAYAQQVNGRVGRNVAFPLMGHDPVSCPRAAEGKPYYPDACAPHHKAYAQQATAYSILFLTHSMLSRNDTPLWKEWNGGNRAMVIIDEKPAAWWGKGSIAEQDLITLSYHLGQLPEAKKRIRAVQAVYAAIIDAQKALEFQQEDEEIQLSITITKAQKAALSLMLPQTDESADDTLRTTLDNLYSLGQRKGVKVTEKKGCEQRQLIIVPRHVPLPALPTLILDATGSYDPEYPADISLLDLDPWENIAPPKKRIQLETWDTNLTKSISLNPEKEDRLLNLLLDDIRALLSKMPRKKVYVIGAKILEDPIKKRLSDCLPKEDFARLIFNHYGNTKGSNAMRQAAAIVFTSVQFKGDAYYRAIALATGKGKVSAKVRVIGRKNRVFTHADVEAIRLRDTIVTLLQEIGRTQIREDKTKELTILLPWSDPQGVAALKDQLQHQFQAAPMHQEHVRRIDKSHLDKLLEAILPGETCSRRDLAHHMGINLRKLKAWLYKKENKKEFWGREIAITPTTIRVPQETHTAATLALAWKQLRTPTGEQSVSQAQAA